MDIFPIRVLVADDDDAVRQALVEVLRNAGFQIAGIASDAAEAVEMARSTSPDVALIDVRMPGGGAAATRDLARSVGGCRVIAVSAWEDRATVLQMLLAGAVGYVVKGAPSGEIPDAVRRAARAQSSLSAEVMTGLMEEMLRELADRSHVEEALRRGEERFRGLVESAPDAVVSIDRSGGIVLVNEQTELMFGYPRSDLLGKPVEFLLPERFHVAHIEHRLRYLHEPRRRPMGVGLELVGRRANGTEFPVDIGLSTLETSGGTLITAFVRDVSERERVREELRGLERMVRADEERRELMAHLVSAQEGERQRIAADVHDDSIQVMTAAAMRMYVLRSSLTDPAQLEELRGLEETIQHAITRLRRLVFELRPRTLDSDGLVVTLQRYLKELDLDPALEVRLDDRLSTEPSAEVRVILYRIALEAITNARKHARPRHLDVRLETSDHGVLLRVGDDGRGFARDEPIAPGHLGLASMRERAQMAEGWCAIRSAPGRGCVVEAWVPDAEAEGAGATGSEVHVADDQTDPMTLPG